MKKIFLFITMSLLSCAHAGDKIDAKLSLKLEKLKTWRKKTGEEKADEEKGNVRRTWGDEKVGKDKKIDFAGTGLIGLVCSWNKPYNGDGIFLFAETENGSVQCSDPYNMKVRFSKELDLSNNNIKEVGTNTLKSFEEVETIDFSNNPELHIARNALAANKKLTNLKLKGVNQFGGVFGWNPEKYFPIEHTSGVKIEYNDPKFPYLGEAISSCPIL